MNKNNILHKNKYLFVLVAVILVVILFFGNSNVQPSLNVICTISSPNNLPVTIEDVTIDKSNVFTSFPATFNFISGDNLVVSTSSDQVTYWLIDNNMVINPSGIYYGNFVIQPMTGTVPIQTQIVPIRSNGYSGIKTTMNLQSITFTNDETFLQQNLYLTSSTGQIYYWVQAALGYTSAGKITGVFCEFVGTSANPAGGATGPNAAHGTSLEQEIFISLPVTLTLQTYIGIDNCLHTIIEKNGAVQVNFNWKDITSTPNNFETLDSSYSFVNQPFRDYGGITGNIIAFTSAVYGVYPDPPLLTNQDGTPNLSGSLTSEKYVDGTWQISQIKLVEGAYSYGNDASNIYVSNTAEATKSISMSISNNILYFSPNTTYNSQYTGVIII